jgi:hypothetical protein
MNNPLNGIIKHVDMTTEISTEIEKINKLLENYNITINNLKIENENLKIKNKINDNLLIKINNLHEENNKLNIQLLDIKSLISIAEYNLEEQYNITNMHKKKNEINQQIIIDLNKKVIYLKNDNSNLYITIILIYIMYMLINLYKLF